MYYVLLDEVQMLDDFESVLNSLGRKKNVDVYVTGRLQNGPGTGGCPGEAFSPSGDGYLRGNHLAAHGQRKGCKAAYCC